MKKFLQKTFAMLVLCLFSMSAMAQDATIVRSNTSNNGTTVSDGLGWNSGMGYLCAPGGTFTISSSQTIVKIVLTENSNYRSYGNWGVSTGEFTTVGTATTWTGSATSVTFTNLGSAAYDYKGVDKFEIWYGAAKDPEQTAYEAWKQLVTVDMKAVYDANPTWPTENVAGQKPANVTYAVCNYYNSYRSTFAVGAGFGDDWEAAKEYYAGYSTTVAAKYAEALAIWDAYNDAELVLPSAPAFPEEGVAYEIRNVDGGTYLNLQNHATYAAFLDTEKEALYFAWDAEKAGFTIRDAEGNYMGKSTANAWNMNSTTPEYWTVEEVSTGVYAFKSASSNYLGFNAASAGSNGFRNKTAADHYAFTIVEYDAPSFDMTEAGWTTFCSTRNTILPAEYTAYIVTGAEGNVLTTEAIQPASANVSVTFDADGTHSVAAGTVTDGTVSVHMDDMNWDNYYGEFYKQELGTAASLVISAPAGTSITRVVFDKDGNYTKPTWPDGSTEMSYVPADATNNIVVTMASYSNFIYFYAITVDYNYVGTDVVIPANAGVLVQGPAADDVEYTFTNDTPSDVTGNLLVGCTADATWNESGKTYYKFSLDADNTPGSEGFYWGVDGGASIEAHAGKAYLVLDGAASNRFLINGFGEETGINAIATESNDAIYNLQGQRVNATAAGIYVKNGKKFIVK